MKAIVYDIGDQYKDKPFEEVTAALADADRSVHRAYVTPHTLKDKYEGVPWDREEAIKGWNTYAANKWDMTEAQKGLRERSSTRARTTLSLATRTSCASLAWPCTPAWA